MYDLLNVIISFLHKQDIKKNMQQTETCDVTLGFTGRLLFVIHFKIMLDASLFLIFLFFTLFHYS
jgi:accessory gene regulator protein AgrB